MSLHFSVKGPNIRTLLSVLLSVGKIGDGVFFVALKDGIEVSAVTSTQNGHIAVRLHERCFDTFSYRPLAHASPPSSTTAASSSEAAEELYICVLAKTLMATVLRQHNNCSLQSVEFDYEATPAAAAAATTEEGPINASAAELDERGDADVVRWRCIYAGNITKVYLLRLADGAPTSVCADATRYHFEVCGDAYTYGSLLASLPGSTGQCGLTLLEGGGLELRSVSNTQQQSSTRSTRANRAGGSSAASRTSGTSATDPASPSAAAAAADGSATVVTAFANSFHLFHFFDVVRAPLPASADAVDDVDASTGPSAVPPTPSPHNPSQQQQQQQEMHSAITASTRLLEKPFVPLPGKVFDVKPFKQATWLADQLGVQLRLRCGEMGTPLVFASITPEEVTELKTRCSSSSNADATRPPPPALARSTAAAAVIPPPCISFAVHVAALDTTDASAASAATAAAGQEEAGVTTAHSSTVNTPRTSGVHQPSTRTSTASASAAVAVPPSEPRQGTKNGGEDCVAPSPSADFVLASATRSSLNAGLNGQEVATASYSSGQHSLSHVEASFTSRTPEGAAAVPSSTGAASLHAPTDSAFTTPRPSLSNTSDVLMVLTGGDTPASQRRHTSNKGASGGGGGSGMTVPPPQPPSTSYTAAALNSMYPLDFAAFARTYTTSNDAEAEDGEEEEEDAQDVALREFLASCVASLSHGSTQN